MSNTRGVVSAIRKVCGEAIKVKGLIPSIRRACNAHDRAQQIFFIAIVAGIIIAISVNLFCR